MWTQQQVFGKLLEKVEPRALAYRQTDDLPQGKVWSAPFGSQGLKFSVWAAAALPGIRLASCFEIPYATANGTEVTAQSARQFGANLATALWQYLKAGR